jgi:hypothetical protein
VSERDPSHVVEVARALERLRAPHLAAKDVRVAGIRLHDPATSLDSSRAIAAHCSDPPCISYSYSSDGTYAIQREGEPALRPYPLAERHADVLAQGGWIDLDVTPEAGVAGRVRVRIAAGRVTDIELLPDAWLAPLGLDTRAAVSTVFGHNDHLARSYGKTTWAWPERSFAVVWDDEHDRLDALALGERACASVRRFDARDLIVLAMQWKRRHPGDDWPLRPHPESPYDSIMAGRIAALLRAYGLGRAPSLDSLCEGTFLGRTEQERATALLEQLEAATIPFTFPAELPRSLVTVSLPRVWAQMFELRRQIAAIDAFNEGVLVASGVLRHVVELGWHASTQLEPLRQHLDRALASILDPAGRSFAWGELVREYGFPDADLDQAGSE